MTASKRSVRYLGINNQGGDKSNCAAPYKKKSALHHTLFCRTSWSIDILASITKLPLVLSSRSSGLTSLLMLLTPKRVNTVTSLNGIIGSPPFSFWVCFLFCFDTTGILFPFLINGIGLTDGNTKKGAVFLLFKKHKLFELFINRL